MGDTGLVRCGCGASTPDMEGPTHAYFGSTPGCWHLFGEVMARDYADYSHGALHNLAVDTYAAQHPHNPDRRNRQSVGVHLISLCAILERNVTAARASTLIGDIAFTQRRRGWEWPHLVPEWLGAVTITDVHDASGPEAHREQVRLWASSVWDAFSEHQPTVRSWLDAAWS